MNKILRQDDILKIGKLLSENGYSDFGLAIVNYVDDQETLNKINEDFFYRSDEHKEKKEEDFDYECAGVNVNCNGIDFKFRLREEDDDSQEE